MLTSWHHLILVCANWILFQNYFWISSLVHRFWSYFSTVGGLPQLLYYNYSGVLPASMKDWLLWLHLKYAYKGNDLICHFEIDRLNHLPIFQKHGFVIFNRCCLSSHTILMWYLGDQSSVFSSHYGRESNLFCLGPQGIYITVSAV